MKDIDLVPIWEYHKTHENHCTINTQIILGATP